MYKYFFKRLLDLLIGLIGLVFFSPLILLLAIILIINNGGDPFFYQERPGKKGKIFKVMKFKTMNDKKDAHGNLLPDSLRISKVGRFVRKTSLDELPQIMNVLKGHMSIIGPRPLLPEYMSLYNERQRKRHLVRPGITGWAQINGRNAISWEKKFEYDVWYVENMTFLIDLKIFFLTFAKVFKSEGISKKGATTTTKFKGNV